MRKRSWISFQALAVKHFCNNPVKETFQLSFNLALPTRLWNTISLTWSNKRQTIFYRIKSKLYIWCELQNHLNISHAVHMLTFKSVSVWIELFIVSGLWSDSFIQFIAPGENNVTQSPQAQSCCMVTPKNVFGLWGLTSVCFIKTEDPSRSKPSHKPLQVLLLGLERWMVFLQSGEKITQQRAQINLVYIQLQQQSYSVFKSLLKKDKETLKISGNNVDFKLKLHHLSSKYNKVQSTGQVFKNFNLCLCLMLVSLLLSGLVGVPSHQPFGLI